MTGPTSAVLFVGALTLGMAGVMGIKLPAERLTLPMSWAVAVGAGCRSAYRIWLTEHEARISAEKDSEPRYEISFHEPDGSPVLFSDKHPSLYFRLHVENKSNIPIASCEGWATEIYKNGNLSPMSAVKLTWVGTTPSSSITLRPYIPRHLDICFIRDDNEGVLCTENLAWPVDQLQFFRLNNVYKFKIVVSAENSATPSPVFLEWTLGKRWKSAKMRVV